jgi:hypothetical protein
MCSLDVRFTVCCNALRFQCAAKCGAYYTGCVFDVQFRCAVSMCSFKVRFDVRFDVALKGSMCNKLTGGKT